MKSFLLILLSVGLCAGFSVGAPPIPAHSGRAARAPGLCLISASGTMFNKIQTKLTEGLSPTKIELVNNSHKHAGHAGVGGRTDGESHFAVDIVSDAFEGKRAVARHQIVYGLLTDEMEGGREAGGIHALEIKARTVAEAANSEAKSE